ncbi:hypothetical protein F5984_21100 [Rudanella paleaurantiibacter]|uniref:DUF3311 domain-containing protein n=1 Tax=Rudanella paleaurantiibacter TaxID=2614655 RepID=A0A7J5TU88_9BACT|nr:hypothetical protein [Rudanella paleaurantiibacter]KAB7727570.1 hypothetical protein F5984_21100 [Rudanella paleaurantiibacter]
MKTKRLLFISLLFAVLLNEPVLSIVSQPRLLAGIPLTYAYILLVWGLMIIVLVALLHKHHNTDDTPHADE